MGYYKLHTQGPLHSSGSATQQLISSLTFIPQISVHKGAMFKCQVSYAGKDKIVEERVSEKFTILCKKWLSLIHFASAFLWFSPFMWANVGVLCLLAAPEVSEIQLAETQNNSGTSLPPCCSLAHAKQSWLCEATSFNILFSRCHQHDCPGLTFSSRRHYLPLVLPRRWAEPCGLPGFIFPPTQFWRALFSLQSV